jgi:hypothetical protein
MAGNRRYGRIMISAIRMYQSLEGNAQKPQASAGATHDATCRTMKGMLKALMKRHEARPLLRATAKNNRSPIASKIIWIQIEMSVTS